LCHSLQGSETLFSKFECLKVRLFQSSTFKGSNVETLKLSVQYKSATQRKVNRNPSAWYIKIITININYRIIILRLKI
jgi:hypothetical protein